MSTIPDHSNVENNSPTVTDHSSNLASISECLAVLDQELSMIPTLRASLATSLSSSMVIKGRPCCGPYFLIHTFILLFKWPVLIFNLQPGQPGLSDLVYKYACSTAVLAISAAAALANCPITSMHYIYNEQARLFKYSMRINPRAS